MKLHQRIMHHVRRHREKVVAHVKKHHKKYIMGAGILSGMALYKIIGVVVIFFGSTYIGGGALGADYYDAEWEASQSGGKINISNIAAGITGDNIPATGCTITGDYLSGTTGNCPTITK